MPVYLACGINGRAMKEMIKGTGIHYRISGTGTRRVLLLHGWGCDMKLMQPVADALEQTHRILMIDFPGHGQSGRPPEPWGVSDFAECLKELLEKLDFCPCSVIAHSFGCRVTAWTEAHYPEIFDRIVFTGAAGIRPKANEKEKKRNARYKRLKEYCRILSEIPFLSTAAGKWEEKLKHKYGSRD